MTSKHLLVYSISAAALAAAGAHAQQGEGELRQEKVVVTGSYIAGSAEDAALPVDVITAGDMQLQGTPSMLELLKSLPVSSGVLGDTNQFDGRAQGSEGSGTVNLRGLGASRTLVLLNGRRLAPNPFAFGGSGAVDTNILPLSAVGRIEILKDGAAAIYGSDAVAGVVNFITRTDYEGFEVSGDFRFVDDSDGDYTLNAIGGWKVGPASFMLAGGYQERSELAAIDRDFAVQDYLSNPQGGISLIGNPGAFLPVSAGLAPVAGITRDPGCADLGGTPLQITPTVPGCGFQFTRFDNVVEDEERFQLFGQMDYDISADHTFHVEGFYSETEVPNIAFSPSFPPVGGASAPTSDASGIPDAAPAAFGRFFVPANNPGFAAFQQSGVIPATAAGAFTILTRPLGSAGNPLAGGRGAERSFREYEAFRISSDLKGKLAESVNYTVGFTYGSEQARRSNEDTLVNRYALALRGFGGETCDIGANTPGQNGCLFFNPFSNAVQSHPVTGETNPNFDPATANSLEVVDFFLADTGTEQEYELLVIDAVLDGQLNFELGGGAVGWAFGGQYREEDFSRTFNDLSNLDINPCIATITTGATDCAVETGPFGFLSGSRPLEATQDIYAVFGEVNLPITDKLNAQVAARFEDYGGAVGSTFDPKLAVRYQATEQIALRGSVGTTFRGPALTQIASGAVTSLQNIGGTFRAVDIAGNEELEPESALTYNAGVIFDIGNFNATVDYWGFDFDDSIVTEPVADIVAAVFPTGQADNCNNPEFAALVERFTFSGDCSINNVSRLTTEFTNGPNIQTSGIDILADYTFEDVFRPGMDVQIGFSGSHVLEYDIKAVQVEGITVAEPFSAAGFLNFQTIATPLPETKFEAYANANFDRYNFRWTTRFIGEYDDQRDSLFTVPDTRTGSPVLITQGQTIESITTHDATLVVQLPWDTTASFTVENIFDEDPSFARLELNFDPFTGDPIGRTFKIGVTKRFGGPDS